MMTLYGGGKIGRGIHNSHCAWLRRRRSTLKPTYPQSILSRPIVAEEVLVQRHRDHLMMTFTSRESIRPRTESKPQRYNVQHC